MMSLRKIIGLNGVEDDENSVALRCAKYFNIMMVPAVFWMMFTMHMELRHTISTQASWTANFSVWCFFVAELVVLTALVDHKLRYLKDNWLSVVIVFAGLPLLFFELGPVANILRLLRLLFIFRMISPWVAVITRFLTDSRLDTTVIAAFSILLMAGMVISAIDPNIKTVEDGVWWAWVTISTVGYGDLVPATTVGRMFAGLLILIGMGIFSVITANFAAIFVQRKQNKNKLAILSHIDETIESLREAEERETLILKELVRINLRLDKLEKLREPASLHHDANEHDSSEQPPQG